MIKIRLERIGKKNEPHFRIVVIPEAKKRNSKSIEYLGYYNPRSKQVNVKLERAKYWLSVGAQPTNTVRNILVKYKLIKPLPRIKRELKKPKKGKKEEEKTHPEEQIQKLSEAEEKTKAEENKEIKTALQTQEK